VTHISIFRGLFYTAVLVGQLTCWTSAGFAAPTPTDPNNMAGGGLPGAYPISVTAANINAKPVAGSELGGPGSDDLMVTFFPNETSPQPFKWTDSRQNEGDLNLLIGPANPTDPAYLPPNPGSNFSATAGAPETLAWRLSRATGAALATVRHNGVDNQDTSFFVPVETIHGVAYFNLTSSSGWGFRMNDGVYANGGSASTDLQMGVAGFDGGLGEATFNTAVAYFPYEQGWVGAWVNPGTNGEATFANSSPGLPTSSVNHTNTTAFVKLPGVDSDTDGMLFVASTDDNSNRTNIAAAFPNNDGWTVSIREDEDTTVSGDQTSLAPGDQNDFQFLYVPYSAQRLVGGHVNGSTGGMIRSAGDNLFDITRTSAGTYSVSVYEANGSTKLDENDGMLILSVAGAAPGAPTLADRKFMSYEYDAGAGNFLIESREMLATGRPKPFSEDVFGNELALRDVNFNFAWVDFLNPLAPPSAGIPGDYNNDGKVDAADYVVWRKTDGTPVGYNTWRTNFGRTSGAGSGALADAAVPEPASLALCALAIGLIAIRRGR
jgi:hypothetical protein